jgi:hypothetical protein
VSVAIAASFWASSASALEDRPHSFALYGIFAFMDGDMTFGENESEVDIDAADVLDSLEIAAFARYRYQAEDWAFVLDGQFAGIGDTLEEGPVTTDLDLDLYIFQADGAYRFSDTAEALIGVRYVRFESALELRFAGDGQINRGTDASFWDPVIGLRTITPLGDRLRLQAQGDAGGGANMDFTWQAMINLGWALSDSTSVWGGYRALGMEFDESGGRNRLDADLVMHGPQAGIVFQF